VVTVHDLHFMTHPERTSAEVRRDYPALAAKHARRADRIIVSSNFAAGELRRMFNLPPEKIAVCPAGAPEWARRIQGGDPAGYLLFVGTLDARKNIPGLLDAYEQLLSRHDALPRLLVAGRASADAGPWLERMRTSPLAGHVEYLGYVSSNRRLDLFRGARLFLMPSFEEGFGLPALEAMAAGVPVIGSNRGSIPEVLGDGGVTIEPADATALAAAVESVLTDHTLWENLQRRGLARAEQFSWAQTARDVRRAYEDAIRSHAHRD
jgi:glycosyltransferase involved in cell wall biosynthesis